MTQPHILFVTGKLAEPALRRTLAELSVRAGFEFSVAVLPITVASLATTAWIARHLPPITKVDKVMLPGLCSGDLAELAPILANVPVERGPQDLRDLPQHFGKANQDREGYGGHDITILAEINHAPRLPLADLLTQARKAKADGADVIDLGCDPGSVWSGVSEAVRALRGEGLRVSLDTFDTHEAEQGARAGGELVLSVNHTNRHAARDWGCAVVAVPDDPTTLGGLDETLAQLEKDRVAHRIDPVLEPIGFGFAASLGRYLEVRRRYPDAEMLMGVGNLTELTDVDSAGVNVLLLGFCQEIGIRSVLTTEVINWCRSSIRELDLARRLVHFACQRHVLPKNLEPGLVMLRDPRLRTYGDEMLKDLAERITDRNFRLFAEAGLLHVINDRMHLTGTDPFALFQQVSANIDIDSAHAFYLGHELAKAEIALKLSKNYVQDRPLMWGLLGDDAADHHAAG